MPIDARTEKLIRRTTMIGTVTAAYFLLMSDFGPQPNALDPIVSSVADWKLRIKRAIESAQVSLRSFVIGSDKRENENAKEKPKIDHVK